ncbi:MAG: hypothetical protein KC636_25315 [Myxococcales bacterium]|nr:hypothetical protein [Myxococcales bacterium]
MTPEPPPASPQTLPDRPLRPPAAVHAHERAMSRILGVAQPPPSFAPPPAELSPWTAITLAPPEPADAGAKAGDASGTTGEASPVVTPGEGVDDGDPEADAAGLLSAVPAYFVRVEPPSLAAFHGRLARLEPVDMADETAEDRGAGSTPAGEAAAAGEAPAAPAGGEAPVAAPATKARVLMYGASGTAADISVGYVRTYLQDRFGDGGPGFIPLGRMNRWYRHSEVTVEASKGWRKEHAQWKKGRLDGHYGLLGASFASKSKRDWVRVSPRRTPAPGPFTAELHYLLQPGGGRFKVTYGDKTVELKTAADALGPGFHTLELPDGLTSIELRPRGDGEVRLFGVVLEAAGAGVVVDTLGINGTRSANHLAWNEDVWAAALRRRAPDLITLSYGSNESVDVEEEIPMATYRAELRTVLERLRRVAPAASCVLLLPTDFPLHEGDQLLPRARLREIIDAQRAIAPELGCGLWDGMAFMGGFGAIREWVAATPPLARDDYLHFTRQGGAIKGAALSDALLLEYDWSRQ